MSDNDLCNLELPNILQRYDVNFTTTMSSTVHPFTSDKAVDGQYGPTPETCDCCSETVNSLRSWWKLDLSALFPIAEVQIYGREDGKRYRHTLKKMYICFK